MLSHPEPCRNKCDISPSRPRDVVLVEAAQVEIAASARRQPGSLAAHSRFRNRPQPLAAKAGRPQYDGHFSARPNRASLLASWVLPGGSIQESQTKSAARPDSRKLSTIGRRNTAPASLLLEAEKWYARWPRRSPIGGLTSRRADSLICISKLVLSARRNRACEA